MFVVRPSGGIFQLKPNAVQWSKKVATSHSERALATEESIAKAREIIRSPRPPHDDWIDFRFLIEQYWA